MADEVQGQPGVNLYDISGPQAQKVNIHPDDVQSAIASGKYSFPKGDVKAVDADGSPVTINAKDAAQAFQSGYKYATPEIEKQVKYSTPTEQLKAGLEGVAGGFGSNTVSSFVEKNLLGADPEAIRAREEVNPKIHAVGEIGGLIAGQFAGTGEAALLGKAAEMAKIASKINEATKLGKIGGHAISMATEMAIMSGDDEVSKMILKDPNASIENAIPNIGLSTLLGAGGGVALGSLSPLWKVTGGKVLGGLLGSAQAEAEQGILKSDLHPLVKRILSTYGGVSEEAIDSYLNNHQAIQNVPEFAEIYGKTLDHIGSISDKLESAKMTASEAKASFDEYAQGLKDEFRQKGFDASMANTMAKQTLRDAQSKLATDLQQNAINTSERVATAVESLRKNVIDQSSEAYNILANSDKKVSLLPFLDKGNTLAKTLETEGTLESKAMAERLRSYLNNVDGMFAGRIDLLDGQEAKKLIQGLDKVSTYDFNATSFDKNLSKQYKQLRWTLDDTLKSSVPEYAEAMKPLAKDTSLLRNLENYGTSEEASRRLKSLKLPDRFKNEIPLLEALEKRTGSKFLDDVRPYADQELKSKLMKSLPEYGHAQKTASALSELRSPATKKALEAAIESSQVAAERNTAEASLASAKEEASKLKGLTPATLEGKLKTVKAGRSIESARILGNIPGIEGKSIPEILDLMRMNEAFEKNATRGSKHVNLYGATLGGIAGLITGGPQGALAGAAAGAGLGSAVDSHGPQFVRKILDQYMAKVGPGASKEEQRGFVHALMGMLKTSEPPIPEAFQASMQYATSVDKGFQKVKNSVASLFKYGAEIGGIKAISDHDRKKLSEKVEKAGDDPTALMDVGGQSGHYLAGHSQAIGETAGRVVEYLNQIRPKAQKLGTLDPEVEPSKIQKSEYNKALDIAEQPLSILKDIRDGTIRPQDVGHLKAMYPNLYNQMAMAMHHEIIEKTSKEENIPYQSRLSLSLFLGEPLDSTMSMQGIQSAQATFMQSPTPQQAQGKPKGKHSMNGLNKLAEQYQTPQQARTKDKSTV